MKKRRGLLQHEIRNNYYFLHSFISFIRANPSASRSQNFHFTVDIFFLFPSLLFPCNRQNFRVRATFRYKSPHSISKSTRSVDRRIVINKLRSLYAEIFTFPPFADSCREDVTSSNNGGPVVNVDAYNTEHVSLSVRSFSIN